MVDKPKTMVETIDTGGGKRRIKLNFHEGQIKAWDSRARFVAIIAGTRAGKTSLGSWLLHREMIRKGSGNYICAAPHYGLLDKGAVPEIDLVFKKLLNLGDFRRGSTWSFDISERGERALWGSPQSTPTRIILAHADNPDMLEGFAAKAAWLDECGQRAFRLGSWEAVQRRLSIDQGRVFMTTTPYFLGWLHEQVFKRWKRGDKDYQVINFRSTMNPTFPVEEYERARRSMPGWKFRMMYNGAFEKPAGMIYDCWDDDVHVIRTGFNPPAGWERYVGLDFGGVNTSAVFIAIDPESKKRIVYNEYHHGSRTAKEHTQAILRLVPGLPTKAIGGANSEDNWRREFTQAGLPIAPPDQFDVEVGILRCYHSLKAKRTVVSEKCQLLIDDITGYSREVDDAGEPIEGTIEDKAIYHRADAWRYINSWLDRIPDPVHAAYV